MTARAPPEPDATEPPSARGVRRLAGLAVYDALSLAFLGLLALGLAVRAPGTRVHAEVLALLALVSTAMLASRLRRRPAVPLVLAHRLALLAGVVGTYVLLGDALPRLSSASYDAELRALDVALLGAEPVEVVARWVSSPVAEWLAFFYLSYFAMLLLYVLPLAVASQDELAMTELATSLVLACHLGQSLYVLVPAYGPYALPTLGDPLPRGFWVDLMDAIVRGGGAQKDVFPSLHTALPVVLAVHALRHARSRVERGTAGVIAFVAANIVAATIGLRWHYFADVVAGALLAVFAIVVGRRVARWDVARRPRRGLPPAWPLYPVCRARSERP